MPVMTPLAIYIKKDHQATRHANSQTKQVKKRIHDLPSQIPNGNGEEIFKHGSAI
jgi:hypothetical protein